MRNFVLSLFLVLTLIGCQSLVRRPVQVGSSYPQGQCEEVGQVIGNANTHEGARNQAMLDLKEKASFLGATYVRIIAETAHGTAIRGIGYRCQ